MKFFKYLLPSLALVAVACNGGQESNTKALADGTEVTIEKSVLKDKIKGGWAGQVIGCTYGGPTEFKFNGTMISDHIPIKWDDNCMLWYYQNSPGLYDDVYMDLTFVDVMERYGLDATVQQHAEAFANANYALWHANQCARFNILSGINPPASGHWKNNPHADDIDFQIEADFAGMMTPGMVKAGSDLGWKIGHIMNYGDGVYGGIYVGALYSLAYVYDDIPFIVREALKSIPAESEFYECIDDVIKWHALYPEDWKSTWFEVEKKWTYDKGCPDGVFTAFNIDAKINAAYIVMGLLYGKGDFGATIDIATRCGSDSDCNPASAAGILGVMYGYDKIPEFWKQGIEKVEDLNFSFPEMSLNDVYEIGYRHTCEMIMKNGGSQDENQITLKYQGPQTVPFEQSFTGIYPLERIEVEGELSQKQPEQSIDFEGCGYVLTAQTEKVNPNLPDIDLLVDVYVDGKFVKTAKMPTEYRVRALHIHHTFELPEGKHNLTIKAHSIPKGYWISFKSAGNRKNEMLTFTSVDPGKRVFF